VHITVDSNKKYCITNDVLLADKDENRAEICGLGWCHISFHICFVQAKRIWKPSKQVLSVVYVDRMTVKASSNLQNDYLLTCFGMGATLAVQFHKVTYCCLLDWVMRIKHRKKEIQQRILLLIPSVQLKLLNSFSL
jgi:hypothetical protein